MAVYERTYRPYADRLTPQETRFLVLTRYAAKDVFRSRLFVAFLALAVLVVPLIYAAIIYVPHNETILNAWKAQGGMDVTFEFGAAFFRAFMLLQSQLAFLVALVVGPALISADLRNNGLPLYLSRPFNRFEYVLGKATVLVALLSVVTWIPGITLYLFRAYLAGWSWFVEHIRVGIAVLLAGWIWVLVLSLLSLALSAYVKWKSAARIGLIGVFVVFWGFGGLLNGLLNTSWGSLIRISDMLWVVWSALFGIKPESSFLINVDLPLGAALLSLTVTCLIFVALLARKVRAYEVVR